MSSSMRCDALYTQTYGHSDCPPVKCTLIVHSKFLPNNLILFLLQKKVFNYPLFNSTDYGKKESKINSGNDYSFSAS